jgi:RHS repeat-associated protein
MFKTMNSDCSTLPRRLVRICRSWLASAACLPTFIALMAVSWGLPQAAQAECSLCGTKRIGFGIHVPASCEVKLTYGDQTQVFTANNLPKTAQGFIKIDMNSGGVPVTTASAGEMKDIKVKADLTQFPHDRYVGTTATFSACGVQMSKTGLSLWRHAPFDPGQPGAGECTCTPSSTIPGTPEIPAHWAEVGTLEGVGYATQEAAQAVLDGLTLNNNNASKVEGSVTAGDGETWGYTALQMEWRDTVPATDPVVTPGSVDPYCPLDGTQGPPDPWSIPQPPIDQTTDELTIRIELPGTGSGGQEGKGGTLGGGGMSIQPSPPPDSDDGPQMLPMSWVWDAGLSPFGEPVGTLALITDLTEMNPLALSKFSTRAGQLGSLQVSALAELPAGQQGWQVAPPPVDEAALEAELDSMETQLHDANTDLQLLDIDYSTGTIDEDTWRAQMNALNETISRLGTRIAGLGATLSDFPSYAASVLKFHIVELAPGNVEVRRFKGGEATPSVVHVFELDTVAGLPAIRHTETVGTSSRVDVAAGIAAPTGGRSWRLEDPDGSVRTGTESPWTHNEQLTDESTFSDGGDVFVQRVVTRRVKKNWGVEVVEESVYDSDAPGAVPEVTSYDFYEIASQTNTYSKLKWRTNSDGTWDRYDYLPNGDTRTYRPWKDGPASPDLATLGNCRSTLTSADGRTVTETIAGQVVLTTMSSSTAGVRHPHYHAVPSPLPPEYSGSNLTHYYTRHTTTRTLPGADGISVSSESYVNNSTGRTDWSRDEAGNVTAYEEFPDTVTISGVDIPVTRRVRLQTLQPWVAGAPATVAPLREVTYTDSNDRLLKTETWAADDSIVSATTYTYDTTTGRQTQVVQDGHTIYDLASSTDGDGNRIEIETDAYGGKTRTITSPSGEMVSRSKLAVDGTTALITTTTSKDGLTETTSTTGGGLTRSSSVTLDAKGRTTQQVDEEGVTTNFDYQDGGRTVIEKDVANNVLKTTRQYLDGQLQSVEGPAVVAEYHDYDIDADGLTTETVRYGTVAGAQYRKRVTNGLGQLLQDIEPPQDGGAVEKVTQYVYDENGRLETTQITGMAPVKVLYDGLGRTAVQRVLLGDNGTASADDPVTTRTWSYETEGDALWEVSTTSQATDASAAHDLVTTQKRQLGTGPDAVQASISADGTITTQSTSVARPTATVTTTMSSSRATRTAMRIVVNGLLQSETSFTATTATTYTYDGLERPDTVTTPEGVVHKTIYDDTAAGIARSRVKQQQLKPVGGSFITQSSYAYHPLGAAQEGRLQTLTNAENATTIYTYDAAGHVLTQTGTASYPLRYEYDTLGRLWKLHTYRAASPDLTQDGDVTTWVYDEVSGKLTRKLDAANHGPTYAYTTSGLLHTRTWQRGVVTTYTYDGAGRLTGIDYDDTTPDVSHGYDRAGRRISTTDAAGTHTLAYDGSQLDTWTVSGAGAPWSGLSMDYDLTAGRRSGRTASLGGITVPGVSYAYAASSGALESVSTAGPGGATVTATYRSTATTGWQEGVTYAVGSSTKLTSTRTPDARGRLEAVSWANGANAVLSGHDYTLDEMNRRTAALRQDGSKWTYGYNSRGEVTSAAKEDAAQIPEPGKQYGFAFDGLGNRTSSTVSSVADNEVLRTTGYTANELNQYSEITHPQPGWMVLRGSANPAASVTIDGNPPTLRAGQHWHHEQSVDNSAGAVRRVAEVTATRPDGGTNNAAVTARHKGALFIPPPVEVVTHDDDGNQTSNAHWSYTWDGENRLILAEEKVIPVAVAAGVSMPAITTRKKLEFSYDSHGRRLTKKVYEQRTENGAPGTFVLKQSLVFLYDGWNMIAEIDTTTSARLIRSYEWGLDMSGTFHGAGGVGGLLVLRTHPSTINTQPSTGAYAPCYDGNGNVMELVNLATGGVSARYECGAFGETISVDGDAIADVNPIRFSTKYLDGETGLLYYTHRYYDAANGRWKNKDRTGERGGANLLGFVNNDGVNLIDVLGEAPGTLYKTFEEAAREALRDTKESINTEPTHEHGTKIWLHYDFTTNEPKGFSYSKIIVGPPPPKNMNEVLAGKRAGIDLSKAKPAANLSRQVCLKGSIHSHPKVDQKAIDDAHKFKDSKGKEGANPFSGGPNDPGGGDFPTYDKWQNPGGSGRGMPQHVHYLILMPSGEVWRYVPPLQGKDNKPGVDWDKIQNDPSRVSPEGNTNSLK